MMAPKLRARCPAIAFLFAATLVAADCWGEDISTTRAREYFQAGAQAYSLGEFGAAIQAFEQAYALAPRPAVLFSIAQAERRQYFLSQEPVHLQRAVDMYRRYLSEETQMARKADTVQALSELEPILAQISRSDSASETSRSRAGQLPTPPPAASPTRVMISSPAQGAVLSLDGQVAVPSPLVREVDPGEHRVRIEAPGYRSVERRVIAVSGELVTVDVPLLEKPAYLVLQAPSDAQLSVDGRVQGRTPFPKPLELSAGTHLITVSKSGFVGISREQTLVRGQTTVFKAPLRRSGQRTAALYLAGASASALVTGGILGYIAHKQSAAANTFLRLRGKSELYPTDLADYASARSDYEKIRGAAWLSVGVGVGFGITSLILRNYDSGSVETITSQEKEPQRGRKQEPSLAAQPLLGKSFAGLSIQGAF
jgi:hypothetical protein